MALENLKAQYFPHHPDESPVVLHRADVINARQAFKNLQNPKVRARFDNDLLRLVSETEFRVVAVVIDKLVPRQAYAEAAAHPYHLGLGFLLQRYAGYLNNMKSSHPYLINTAFRIWVNCPALSRMK